ncbi:succinyldiaminopimelate transaminase [Canibacter zhoujuaniae]|uniref:succinyldiaminopimelate transaminase n=1 Tax=Canibacter zhoujuaniae TaxID=2708343 RepID=UPI001420A28E|nr:succinyldiaminopimelate transaminase [Canibacter zhoujuaniae]
MRQLPEYPWDTLKPYVDRAKAHPEGAIDLSVGSPVDATPDSARAALADASAAQAYPATVGSLELREAIVAWYQRRRGVQLAETNVLPTVGSKELVALLPFLLGLGAGDAVVYPEIAYPSYEMGAALVGAAAVPCDDPANWPENTKLVWVNSPANPHGRVLSLEQLREAVTRARELGAVLVSDECYAEFGWEAPWDSEPIPSVLDARVVGEEMTGVLAAYSLSKQSNLAGYRAAFVAGDAELISQLLVVRKHAGLMVPAPIQAATVAALADDNAVSAQKQRYQVRREVLLPALQSGGWQISHSEAGLYLWATQGVDCWDSISFLAERGIIAGPGIFYGAAGAKHVRFALTATDEKIAAAADRLRSGNFR